MDRLKKIFICIAVVMSLLFSAVSCSELFVSDNSASGDSNSANSQYKAGTTVNYTVTVASGSFEANDLETTIANVRPAVVEIYATLSDGLSSGSGVIIDINDSDEDGLKNALIVTCHHVIEKAKSVSVRTVYGISFDAEFIASDPVSDIGLIQIEETETSKLTDVTFSQFADTTNLAIGREVIAIGNPLGVLGGTVTKGIVSAIDRSVKVEGRTMTLIQTDAAINSGNSGGGLFDSSTGVLLGIVNAGVESSKAQGLSFAIPANTALPIVEQLLEKGYIEGDYDFGITLSIGTVRSGGFFSSSTYYVYISAIDENGTFYKAGIRQGDIIASVQIGNKAAVTAEGTSRPATASANLEKVQEYMSDSRYAVGDKVTLRYGRIQNNEIVYSNAEFEILQYKYN